MIEAFRLAKTACPGRRPVALDLGLVLVGTDTNGRMRSRIVSVASPRRALDRELPVRGTVSASTSSRAPFAGCSRRSLRPVDEVVESIIESPRSPRRPSSRSAIDGRPAGRGRAAIAPAGRRIRWPPGRPIRIAPAAAAASEPSDAESVPASFPTPPTPTSTPVPAPEPEVVESRPVRQGQKRRRSLRLEPIHWSIPAASSVRFAADESVAYLLASDRETSSLEVASSWIRAQRSSVTLRASIPRRRAIGTARGHRPPTAGRRHASVRLDSTCGRAGRRLKPDGPAQRRLQPFDARLTAFSSLLAASLSDLWQADKTVGGLTAAGRAAGAAPGWSIPRSHPASRRCSTPGPAHSRGASRSGGSCRCRHRAAPSIDRRSASSRR